METYLWKHEMFSFSHVLITYFSVQWPWPGPSPMETNRKVANLKRFSLSRVPAGFGDAFSLLVENFSMKQTFSTMWNYSALCQYATHPLAIANWKAYWKVAAKSLIYHVCQPGWGMHFHCWGCKLFNETNFPHNVKLTALLGHQPNGKNNNLSPKTFTWKVCWFEKCHLKV